LGGAQSRGNDARIVQHQYVSGAKVFQNLTKDPVFDPSAGAGQHQQTRFITSERGMLGDPFGRQDKVKISGSHRDLIVAGDGLENRTTFLALIPTKMGVVDNF
jgi:hypothetical protein